MDEGKSTKIIHYPLLSSEDINGGRQSQEEFTALWETFDALSPEKQEIVSSHEIAEKIALLQRVYSLSDSLIEAVSVYLRWYYFDWMSQEELIKAIDELISEKGEEVRMKVREFVVAQILTLRAEDIMAVRLARKQEEGIEEGGVGHVMPTVVQNKKLQVLQALSEYPGIGNQILSEARIKVKSQPEPVRGSISNWIRYYRDELGIGQHSTVERGQFLFRSENGLKLSDNERERLNLVLKSLEENLPLDVDPDRQMIVFPVEAQGKREALRPVHDIPGRVELPSRPTTSSVPVSPNPNMQYGEVRTKPTVPMTQEALGKHTESQPAWAVPSRPSTQAASEKPFISQPVIPQKDLQASKPSAVEVEAERLKREPKPDWIKGAFTKESIPEKTPDTPVAGNVSFSFNHALPAEQEVKQVAAQPQVKPQPTQSRHTQTFNQFHIRPVSMRGKDDLGQ